MNEYESYDAFLLIMLVVVIISACTYGMGFDLGKNDFIDNYCFRDGSKTLDEINICINNMRDYK